MKLKYYLRGAGIGIIVTTIILLTAYAFTDHSMSDEEIMQRARQLGMVDAQEVAVVDPATLPESGDDSQDDSEAETADESQDDSEAETADESSDETADEQDTASETIQDAIDKTTTKSDTTTKAGTTVTKKVPFTIRGGDSSNTVAANLASAGIVDDAQSFSDYLDNNGYDKNIQPGTFYVSTGLSYKEVAQLLVAKQGTRTTSLGD